MTCSRHVANVIERQKQGVVEHLLVSLSSRHHQRTRPRIEYYHLSFTSQPGSYGTRVAQEG
ncbi:hypothetical protein K443DRAFT_685186 [Laccaria amethystina LaAM-08-1]|uniref:Uncharacterized protein n=1 Tax=Laccaria amethystina LaAM-08-1 TaxID=1095629 RepID=A0A0C9X4K7_9AGAR|nr:hypothetical protein K443DRAFT_685186 [Laccaria amethystina LaAM-08-1]